MKKEVAARFTLWSYPGKRVRGAALRSEPGHKASRTELLTVERDCAPHPLFRDGTMEVWLMASSLKDQTHYIQINAKKFRLSMAICCGFSS